MYTYLSNRSTPEIFEADSTPEIFEINPTYASPRVGTFINPGGMSPPRPASTPPILGMLISRTYCEVGPY